MKVKFKSGIFLVNIKSHDNDIPVLFCYSILFFSFSPVFLKELIFIVGPWSQTWTSLFVNGFLNESDFDFWRTFVELENETGCDCCGCRPFWVVLNLGPLDRSTSLLEYGLHTFAFHLNVVLHLQHPWGLRIQ